MSAVPTRRHLLHSAALAVSAAQGQHQPPMPRTKPAFPIPAHACDCHTHIFAPPARFPFAARRSYTPPPATPADMRAFLRAMHLERVVIVTPSVYGTDNAATLHGIAALGNTARGIAVIDSQAADATLDALARGGIRGIRLNLTNAGIDDPAQGLQRFLAIAQRMHARQWHIQINTNPRMIAALRQAVLASPVPVVFDHFGGVKTALGVDQPGFADLVELVRSGHAYVKISGAYRSSTQAPLYADAAPFAQALIAANPARVLWGTDWPHPDSSSGRAFDAVSPPLAIDDALLLNQLATWAPSAATRQQIFVENPARLYGF